MLESALQYAAAGVPVFPIFWPLKDGTCACRKSACGDIGKHPIGKLAPRGFKDATIDPDVIKTWWREYPDANIGIPTGAASGIYLVDADGRSGQESLTQLGITTPPTVITGRPDGGTHRYFRHLDFEIRSFSGKDGLKDPLPGLDFKGDGGYLIAPDSRHESGKRYAWGPEGRPDLAELPDVPKAILNLRRKNGTRVGAAAAKTSVLETVKNVSGDSVLRELSRNVGLTSIAGRYRHYGMEQPEIKAALLAFNATRCEPPLSEAEVGRIARSVSQYEAGVTFPEFQRFCEALTVDTVRSDSALLMKAYKMLAGLQSETERDLGIGVLYAQVKPAIKKATIGREVAKLRGVGDAKASDAQGKPASVESIEPWPDPVDGAQLADTMAATVRRFTILPEHAPVAIALWVLHAWAFDAWQLSPILAFTAPVKSSGKSNALFVTSYMCPRRYTAPDLTNASGFRFIEKHAPTLAIDDAEKLLRQDGGIASLLINGYLREAAVALRCSGDDHEVQEFPIWCPKAVSLVGKLHPDTLHDRAIEIPMKPKLKNETTERRKDAKLPGELLALRRQAMRWAQENIEALREHQPSLPEELHDRAQDNWEPLLAVADLLGGPWPERGRAAALALSGPLDDDVERLPTRLLIAIRDEVLPLYELDPDEGESVEFPFDVIQSTEIVERLLKNKDSPWNEISRGGVALTGAKVARLLKPFGLHPSPTKHDKTRGLSVRGYRVRDLEATFERFLREVPGVNHAEAGGEATPPTEVSERQKPNGGGGASGTQSVRRDDTSDTSKNAERSMVAGDSDALTLPQGGSSAVPKNSISSTGSDDHLRSDIRTLFEANRGSLPTYKGTPCYLPEQLAEALRQMPGSSWQMEASGLGRRLSKIGIKSRPSVRLRLPGGTQTAKSRFYMRSDFGAISGITKEYLGELRAFAADLAQGPALADG